MKSCSVSLLISCCISTLPLVATKNVTVPLPKAPPPTKNQSEMASNTRGRQFFNRQFPEVRDWHLISSWDRTTSTSAPRLQPSAPPTFSSVAPPSYSSVSPSSQPRPSDSVVISKKELDDLKQSISYIAQYSVNVGNQLAAKNILLEYQITDLRRIVDQALKNQPASLPGKA